MQRNRFWLSLIALCVAVACGAAILLAIVTATTALAVTTTDESPLIAKEEPSSSVAVQAASIRQRVLKGVVSDTACNAKHVSNDKTAAECARNCVRHGAQYALISGEKVYLLEGDLVEVGELAGQRAEVVGSVDGDLLTVASIRVAE
jgi:hypothetical protein